MSGYSAGRPRRHCVYDWNLGAWVEPSMERAWFFGRVLAGVWMWRLLSECSSNTGANK